MSDYARKRAKAAKWMYERKDRPVEWWRWRVLTEHNDDSETLSFDDRTAFLIFADLVHDGLLLPTYGSDGQEAFAINPGKDAEWNRTMSPFRYWLAHNVWLIFLWLISTIGSGVIGICLGLWWDKLLGN